MTLGTIPTQPDSETILMRWALPLLLLVAFLHNVQYAALMPPWGLIDEAQHVDYVLRIADRGEFPIAGQTTLEPEIIDSLFSTRHWFVFHWPTPPSNSIVDLGPAGYSYEAYHPPLYYLLLAPAARSAPGLLLDRLFILRLANVLLSLVTVWAIHRLGLLLDHRPQFAALTTLFFVMLPERAAYTSRVNNDLLVELLGAAFCLVTAHSLLQSLTWRRALGMGLLLALGIWTKVSMAFWLLPLFLAVVGAWTVRRDERWLWLLPLALGGAAVAALVARNLLLYADPTGYSAFHAIYALEPSPLHAAVFLAALQDTFRHFWFVWWKGAEAGSSPFTQAIYALLAALTVGSATWGLVSAWRRRHKWQSGWRGNARLHLLVFWLTAALVFLLTTLYSYFQGIVPVIQGRFLAPAVTVYVLLYALGWWQHRIGPLALWFTALLLFVADAAVLWGNLLPYHYYWSSVAAGQASAQMSGSGALALFWANIAMDKPAVLAPLLPLLPVVWLLAASATLVVAWRWTKSPGHSYR